MKLLTNHWICKNKKSKNFHRMIYFDSCFTILFWVINILWGYKNDIISIPLFGLLVLSLFMVIFLNFISLFVFWENFKFRASIPLAISLLLIVSFVPAEIIGRNISLYVFKNRLPEYEAAVKMVEGIYDGKPVSFWKDEIPERFRHLCFKIRGQEYEPGILTVEFYWEYFPIVGNSAYIYRADGKIPENDEDFNREWIILDRINQYWFKGYDDY